MANPPLNCNLRLSSNFPKFLSKKTNKRRSQVRGNDLKTMNKIPKILIVDDEPDIQRVIGDILNPDEKDNNLKELKSTLFGDENEEVLEEVIYDISYANQGEEAVEKIRESKQLHQPFSLIFMDIRMPPGIDGILTIQKVWEIDPRVEVCLCSAYSDYTWDQVILKLGITDKFMILKKPFVPEEISQLALSLTKKWSLLNNLESIVHERTLQLEKANQSKNDFLSKMSHEIRTPMNAIMGFGEILQSIIIDGKQKEYLNAISQSSRSLLRLINDILDISKIEAGQIDIKYGPINPPKFFEECKGLFIDRCKRKGLELSLDIQEDIPTPILLDELRLLQIVLNLLGNSLKFTNSGSIELKASYVKKGHDGKLIDFIFLVKDTGSGIPENEVYKVFDKFYKVREKTTQSLGGTGLGLSITKDLIEVMNGKIEVDSVEGEGSTFTITFSDVEVITDDLSYQTPEIAPESYVFKNSKIVIIEDIEYNSALLKAYLENYDLQLFFAKDGIEGLKLIEKHNPDLIIADIKMPMKDGVSVIQDLKSNDKTKNIPLVITTAMAMVGEVEKLKKTSESFLSKPISKIDMVETLARLLPSDIKEKDQKGKPKTN